MFGVRVVAVQKMEVVTRCWMLIYMQLHSVNLFCKQWLKMGTPHKTQAGINTTAKQTKGKMEVRVLYNNSVIGKKM